MNRKRFLSVTGAAALLVLVIAVPTEARMVVNRGFNPRIGHSYVVHYNPWTGRQSFANHSFNPNMGGTVLVGPTVTPWTGTTVRGVHAYNPWTGRVTHANVRYNPWTGQRHLGVTRW